MKPFGELTEQGKTRRLHGLARTVLGEYDLEVARLRCIARHTNSTFRVDTTTGERFALRVGTDPVDTEVDTPTEVAWLRALEEEPGIDAVHVIPTGDGADLVEIDHPGVDGLRTCVLFSWIPGRAIGDAAGPGDYHRRGELAARLHDHGQAWRRPPGLRPLVWDRIFYYPTEPVVLYQEQYQHLLMPERTRIVRAVEAKAAAELARLHRDQQTFILHGDLHPWNIHTHRGRLVAFDFEDLMVGAPVQDVAISLFYNRDHEAYGELCSAFEEGYRSIRPWPVEWEGQLELLMAARTVSFINYVLRMDFEPEQYIPRWIERIQRVL